LDETFSAVVSSFSKCHSRGSEQHWTALQMCGSMLSSLHHHDSVRLQGTVSSAQTERDHGATADLDRKPKTAIVVPPEGFCF